MSRETQTNYELQGTALQESVKLKLNDGVEQAVQMELPEMVGYIHSLQNHFNGFSAAVDWSKPRSKSEVKTVVGSTVASIHLAHAKSGKDFEQLYGQTNENEWWKTITDVFDDQETRKIFLENMWRSPVLVSPLRGVPLQYLLRFHFGDRQIRGVDLGAGLHVALPLLNSAKYLEAEFPEKDKMEQYADPINISVGLGIDKQQREEALVWAKACYWPLKKNLGAADRLGKLYRDVLLKSHQFPFLVTDLLKQQDSLQRICETVNQDGRFDFVFSSFVRHQLGENQTVQSNFKKLVSKLLRNGGIWVDLGEELITEKQYKTSGVRVYRKKGHGINLIGIPFVLKGQTNIQKVDLDYFKAH